jgi:hypothetical protein
MIQLKQILSVGKPSSQQVKHDTWLIVVAFASTFMATWDGSFSKTAVKAGAVAGLSAAITVVKSIVTTL